jgi:superoxide dismutase, Fe-Mn family
MNRRRHQSICPPADPASTRELCREAPILALDVHEHSHHVDFGAKADDDVETFMEAIRWGNADRLLARLNG